MDKEKFMSIIKWVSLSLFLLIIASTAIALIYPLFQAHVPTVYTNEIIRAKDSTKFKRIDYAKNGFEYMNDNYVEVEEEETPTDVELSSGLYSGYSLLSQQCNLEIYKLCEKYFKVDNISPLYVMAIANNESAIRANKDITFCSLYPSKVVPPKTVDDIAEFNTLKVLDSSTIFSELAADWWTRDRGPVQMNPTYGIHDDSYYILMGESEQSLLSTNNKIYNYSAYTTKEGEITFLYWVEQASSERGDRHNIKDICLRMASEASYALATMKNTYSVSDTRLSMIMLSMHHGAGSLWNSTYKDAEIGYWKSGKIAYGYAHALSQDSVYNIIYSKAKNDVLTARVNSSNPDVGISTQKAMLIYNELMSLGYISDVDTYTVAGTHRDAYIVYPIKMLYNFAQLQILYNGG